MRLGKLWSWFWSLANSVSIRFKIMGIVLVLTLILGLGITFQIQSSLTRTLASELEKYGISIARDLAARSTDLILISNSFDLYQLLKNTIDNNKDVRYAFILGADGNVLSHVFGDGFPVGLAAANPVEPDAVFRLEILDTNEGTIWDVAVPIRGGNVGITRVGISEARLAETVGATTRRLLMYTGLVALIGLIAAYLLTAVLTRPIVHLVEVTRAIAKGDLRRQAPVWAPDEIGRLGVAFNVMTESLAKSRDESEAFQRELLRRNRELSALNAVAAELGGPQKLDSMMRTSLATVLKATDLTVGWVSTVTADGKESNLICHEGLSPEVAQQLATDKLAGCACEAAVLKKMAVVVDNGHADCPVLNHRLSNGQSITCHTAIPVVSKSQVIGLLHVASTGASHFSAEDLQLLSSIGHQMGVAIENVGLWEELKRREEVRGQLLKGTISAQEAERKRIARELHDQTSQSLTALMVGLNMVEAQASETMRRNIADLRQLTAKTLDEVHTLSLELRPSSLDDLGLVAVMQQYAKEYAKRYRIETLFQAMGLEGRRLPSETEIALYRIIQEALTNVAKHSEARKVSVLLEVRDATIVAIVEDDGKGFDVNTVLASKVGAQNLGLYGMQERTALIDGVLTIESTPGIGTTIFIEVPLKEIK